MLKIKSELKNYGINVPTSMSEITDEYFNTLLKDVEVSEHYTLVAICYIEKLFNCAVTIKNKSELRSDVIPVVAKSKAFKTNSRIITDTMSLERGVYFSVPNNIISMNKVGQYIADDKDMYMSVINGSYFKQGNESNNEAKNNAPDCYFVEFRLLPNVDIKATYPADAKFDNIMKF